MRPRGHHHIPEPFSCIGKIRRVRISAQRLQQAPDMLMLVCFFQEWLMNTTYIRQDLSKACLVSITQKVEACCELSIYRIRLTMPAGRKWYFAVLNTNRPPIGHLTAVQSELRSPDQTNGGGHQVEEAEDRCSLGRRRSAV